MHARCNLGVHDMNTTILMVSSGGLCRQFRSLIKKDCVCVWQGKAASYRYQISLHCLQVDKTNSGNETIQCNKACLLSWGYLTTGLP